MGLVSAVLYVVFNYLSGGQVISDSVTACGVFIALYYGITGFTCAWWYRKTLTNNTRDLFMQGIIPVTGGIILFIILRLELLPRLAEPATAGQPGRGQLHLLDPHLPAALGHRRRRRHGSPGRDRRLRPDGVATTSRGRRSSAVRCSTRTPRRSSPRRRGCRPASRRRSGATTCHRTRRSCRRTSTRPSPTGGGLGLPPRRDR